MVAPVGGAAAQAGPGVSAGGVPAESSFSAPTHCTHSRARDFDFWIGEWDVLNRQRPPEGVGFYETGRSTDRVYPVVGGCGIVEHWRGDAFRFILGFSIRAYDPAEDEWTIVLLWPTNGRPSFGELRGGFRHGRGEFSFQWVRPDGDTATNRFTFSDITPNSLRWENATSRDGGLTWMGNWVMEFTRRDPVSDIGLWNGPTMTTRRCPAEEYRRFDGQLGEWAGVRTTPAGDSIPLRAHFVRILEGCAVMERVWSPDGDYEAFRVRAYEPDADRWVLYELDSERRTLVRREAEGRDSPDFREVAVGDGQATRLRWEAGADGAPGWVMETADDANGPWRMSAAVRLEQPIGGVDGT
ncbi:MAG: hypothetical protein ACODAE_06480 [Gemmatimonadota bacterium]